MGSTAPGADSRRPPSDLDGLLQLASVQPEARLGVVAADDGTALEAVAAAVSRALVTPVLFGPEQAIRARLTDKSGDAAIARVLEIAQFVDTADPAPAAVSAAAGGEVEILLKGALRTDEILRAVLDSSSGLRTGRLLSDILLYEDSVGASTRLVAITDGGITIAPTLEQKRRIVTNAVAVLRRVGFERPRVAIMSATEVVSDALPSTVDAQQLSAEAERGDFGACDVFGPLALDNALLVSAAEAKGIVSPVAGHADCLVAPSIEAGNLLGKSAKFFHGSRCAHVVLGAGVPILIPSRVESADDKLLSIALGVLAVDRG